MRTLIKKGNSDALKFFNVRANKITLNSFTLDRKQIKIGEKLNFELTLQNKGNQSEKYILDYEIGYLKANGDLSKKVFKLKTGIIQSGEKKSISASQSFRIITTKKFYPGKHSISVKINGQILKTIYFLLR